MPDIPEGLVSKKTLPEGLVLRQKPSLGEKPSLQRLRRRGLSPIEEEKPGLYPETGKKLMEVVKNLARDLPGFLPSLPAMALSGSPAGMVISPLAKAMKPVTERINALSVFDPLRRTEEAVFDPEKGLFPWETLPTPPTERVKEIARAVMEGKPISEIALDVAKATPGIGFIPRLIEDPESFIERPFPTLMDLAILAGGARAIPKRGAKVSKVPPGLREPEIPFPGLKEKIVPSEKPIPRTVLEEVLGLKKKKPVLGEAELKMKRELKKRGVTEKPAIPKIEKPDYIKLEPKEIKAIEDAWSAVSARYPRLASEIKKIEIWDNTYSTVEASTRTILLSTQETVWGVKRLTEVFGHELTHYARNRKIFRDIRGDKVAEARAEKIGKALAEKPAEIPVGETKIRGLAKHIEERAIEAGLTEGLGDLPKYDVMKIKEKASMASDLITKDPAKAKRIAMGEELPESGVGSDAGMVLVGVEEVALKTGDVGTIRDLALNSKLMTEATEAGQFIRTFAERDPTSPVGAIREVVKVREKVVQKRIRNIRGVKEKLVDDLKTQMKKAKPTKETWAGFIESLRC